MTRIKLLTFIVSFLLIFSILATFLGRGGVIVNDQLRREVAEMQRERERKEAEVGLLEGDLESYERGSGTEGESVFIESIPAEPQRTIPAEEAKIEVERNEGFKGLSSAIILSISLSSAIVMTVAVSFLPPVRRAEKKLREARAEEEKDRRGKGGPSNYDDIDLV